MVDRDVLSSRLSALDGYLRELRSFADRDRAEYLAEPSLHHLAERLLHLACEVVADVAHHVIADEGYRQPTSYRDAMRVLAEEAVIPAELADRLGEWMGFRNVLVHFYADLDHGRSYEAIENDLGDLDEFARVLAKLL